MDTVPKRSGPGLNGVARRSLGIGLLLIVVFLWTASNFLASVCVLPSRSGLQHADGRRLLCYVVRCFRCDGLTYHSCVADYLCRRYIFQAVLCDVH